MELAAEMNERIMVLDGAMGTMLQKRMLEEEDFRGMYSLDSREGLKTCVRCPESGNNQLRG